MVSAVLLTGVLLAPLPSAAAPDGPDRPLTIAAAQRQIALLNHQAEIASEQRNAVRVRLGAARKRLHTLQADVARQRTKVEALRAEVVGSAVTAYQTGAGLSTATSLLVVDDAQQFLAGLANSAVAANQEAGLLARLSEQQQRLEVRQRQAQRKVGAIAAAKETLARHQRVLDAKTERAEQVLASLRKKQRERLARRQARQERRAQARSSRAVERVSLTPSPTPAPAQTATPAPAQTATPAPAQTATPAPAPVASVASSGRGSVAVGYALAQIGDPYIYGATGPDSFDCSGLTMAAWAAAGVSIPHASSLQPSTGTPVSVSALMPGDLVFYYSPISHVGMYIGNGQIVHAPHTGAYVEVVPLNSMPISMAVRVG